jgi:sulfur carrier protein
MQVFVNGAAHDVPRGTTMSELLTELGLAGRRLAVEVNLSIVPHSAHASHILEEGDRIEVVQAIGGG